MSGGKSLLDSLIENLDQSTTETIVILVDNRIKEDYEDKKFNHISLEFFNANEIVRFKYYLKNRKLFRKIFCLANVPPPIKLNCPVMIYFQNILYFDKELQKNLSIRNRIIIKLKAFLIKSRITPTQQWIVQTKTVRAILQSSLGLSDENIFEYPFFEDGIIKPKDISNRRNIFFYPAINAKHKNHERLLLCWESLSIDEDYQVELHLTLPYNKKLFEKISILQKRGICIVNHGLLSKEDVDKIYTESKFVIHPSLGESFGLVLIEALKNQCILLAPDLPYVNSIVRPQYYFDPLNINSMKESVIKAIKGENCSEPQIFVENKIMNLITHLLK